MNVGEIVVLASELWFTYNGLVLPNKLLSYFNYVHDYKRQCL